MRVWLQLVHNLCVKQPQFSARAFQQLRPVILSALASADFKTANVAGAVVLQAVVNGSAVGDDLGEVVDGLLAAAQRATSEGKSCEFPYLALQKIIRSAEVS